MLEISNTISSNANHKQLHSIIWLLTLQAEKLIIPTQDSRLSFSTFSFSQFWGMLSSFQVLKFTLLLYLHSLKLKVWRCIYFYYNFIIKFCEIYKNMALQLNFFPCLRVWKSISSLDPEGLVYLAYAVCWSFTFLRPYVQIKSAMCSVHW